MRVLRAGCTDRRLLASPRLWRSRPWPAVGLGIARMTRPRCGERPVNGLASASAPAALSTIAAAVALTGFATNVFVLTCAPQAPAVPALILGLLDHALASDAIAREGCGRSFRNSKGAHAGSYHYPENGGSHSSSLGVGGLGPARPVPPVAQINQFPSCEGSSVGDRIIRMKIRSEIIQCIVFDSLLAPSKASASAHRRSRTRGCALAEEANYWSLAERNIRYKRNP
jgi:hypothetical protein